ncbi:MAG: hypothetical protein NVS2B7_10820 [Herpetosiphon sp.]
MNARTVRFLIAAVSGAWLALVAVRRRLVPLDRRSPAVEAITIPVAGAQDSDQTPPFLPPGVMNRKVGTNRRISVNGTLYGPLPPEYVGQQVQVRASSAELTVSAAGTVIETFAIAA